MPDLLDEVLVEWRAERERLRAAAPASFDGARDGAVLVKQQVRLAPGEGLPATGTSDA
ncbi:MAG: hypothetical protein M5U28_27165 [Sandaracinaceae bacterium]|nr:hypothetical protein [Sandaracinaceae bacterium]